MRVAFLRELLAELPDDMLVDIGGYHVRYISKTRTEQMNVLTSKPAHCPDCGLPHRHHVGDRVTVAPRLRINTRAHLLECEIFQPDPPIQFYGRWSEAVRAVIDRHSEDPDA